MKRYMIYVVMLLAVQVCFSQTYNVDPTDPSNYNTIQSAVDAAINYGGTGTIIVSNPNTNGIPYTYSENVSINFNYNEEFLSILLIKDQSPDQGEIIINSPFTTYKTISVTGRFENYVLIDGFTIRNGFAGIEFTNMLMDCAYVNNCVIKENNHGIVAEDTMPNIDNCRISGNISKGILENWNSAVLRECGYIKNSEISHNGSDGLNLEAYWDIENCTIVYNGGNGIDGISWFNIKNSIIRYNSQQIVFNNYFYVDYCNVQGGFAGTGNIDDDPIFVDAANEDYTLTWDSDDKSPCIDTGDPNQLYNDPDGTRADMGAFCAIEHRIDTVELPSPSVSNGWKWLSFPTLDVVLDDADIAGVLLYDIMYPVLSSDLDNVEAETYTIEYNDQVEVWENDWRQFLRTEGFKFHMNNSATLDVCGFKEPDNTTISLAGNNVENWVGYWLEETQHVSDAFSEYWDGESINFIQHQSWSAVFWNNEWVYKMTAEQQPTISYGDMVIVKSRTVISNFSWANDTFAVQRSAFPETEYFSFEEQAEYTPIYVELNEANLPQEIGAFVNGICIGAAVVENPLAQINAYTINPLGDVVLELYFNSRCTNETISKYNCGTFENPNIVNQQINTAEDTNAWFVSLRGDSSIIPALEKVTLSNYPNPFNPTTTISYNIPKEGVVTLEIYNIKGQLVKQLVSGTQPEGYYDVVWNGKDDSGKQVSSGIYYYQITACGKSINKKMLMLK